MFCCAVSTHAMTWHEAMRKKKKSDKKETTKGKIGAVPTCVVFVFTVLMFGH